MSDFHGASFAQYIAETAAMFVFGAFFAVVGGLLTFFPNASTAYRMRHHLRAQIRSQRSVLMRFLMFFEPAPTRFNTILIGAWCLAFGIFAICLAIEGIEKLVRS